MEILHCFIVTIVVRFDDIRACLYASRLGIITLSKQWNFLEETCRLYLASAWILTEKDA
jgi:hypothetical protein